MSTTHHPHQTAIIKQTQSLWNKPEFSDCIVKGVDQEYRLHKTVLCRNTFFSGAFNPVVTWSEAGKGVVNMEADDSYALKAFLLHLYGFTFPEGSEGGTELGVEEEIKVWAIADKYGETDLKPLAANDIPSLYAAQPSLDIELFADHVVQAYAASPRNDATLQHKFLETARQHKETLFDRQNKALTMRLFATCTEFAFDMGRDELLRAKASVEKERTKQHSGRRLGHGQSLGP